jgi:hypothetical protein
MTVNNVVKNCRKNWSRPDLKNYCRIFLEGPRNAKQISINIVVLPPDIRIWHLINTIKKLRNLKQLALCRLFLKYLRYHIDQKLVLNIGTVLSTCREMSGKQQRRNCYQISNKSFYSSMWYSRKCLFQLHVFISYFPDPSSLSSSSYIGIKNTKKKFKIGRPYLSVYL